MTDELTQEAAGIASGIKSDMTSAVFDRAKAGVYKVRYKKPPLKERFYLYRKQRISGM